MPPKRKGWNSTLSVGKGFKPRKPWIVTKRTALRVISEQETPQTKKRIQALLREGVIARDGGCFLRHYPQAGRCGSRPTKSGQIILQADHLNSRRHGVSFGDLRLAVCACERHHIHWKKQEPDLYTRLAREFIGPVRSALLDTVQNDHRPHKMDWKLVEFALRQEVAKLKGVDNQADA